MIISARNQLKGTVKEIKTGPVSTEVVIDVNGAEVVSSITTGSAESLNLSIGDEVVAIIKASSIMVGKEWLNSSIAYYYLKIAVKKHSRL